ncbi:MAG: hypothetical protein IPM57_08870 [Oligoflexia bacterium]|nr:hypothetical protein [Oligoflexia bacterium]
MIRTPQHSQLLYQRKMRTKHLLIQRFQYKYALFLMRFGLVFGLLLTGVSIYFLNTNYFMFKNTLLLHAPKVIKALNVELKLANEFIFASFMVYLVFLGWLGLKLSQKLVTPIMLIQEKIKGISRGNLKDAKIELRKDDEFQDFCDSYNYMVEILKTQVETDLIALEKLKPDPKNKDATYTWEKMVEEKNLQLGKLNLETSAQPDQAPSARHAS